MAEAEKDEGCAKTMMMRKSRMALNDVLCMHLYFIAVHAIYGCMLYE